MSRFDEWVSLRASEDDTLYARYARPLEAEHSGEFVAISRAGDVVLGDSELEVAHEAQVRFGAGNFALRRIGADAEIRWRHA